MAMAMTYSVCHQNMASDIAILGHCCLLCTGNGHKSNCWCSARIGKGLGTAWQGSVDAWAGGRGEESEDNIIWVQFDDWLISRETLLPQIGEKSCGKTL